MEKREIVRYQDASDNYEIGLKNAKVYILAHQNKVIVSTRHSPGDYLIKRSSSWNPDDKRRDDSIAYIHVVPSKESATGGDQLAISLDIAERVGPATGETRIRSLTTGEAVNAKAYLRQIVQSLKERDLDTATKAARLLNYRLFDDREFEE